MAFTRFASANTIYAFGGAGASEGGVVGSAFALDVVVACPVGVAAQRANDCTFAYRALCDRMVKRVASIASAKNRECNVFFDSGDCSKEGRRVADKLLYARAIGVNEGDRDRRVSFVGGDGGQEPSRRVDKSEAFADRVSL